MRKSKSLHRSENRTVLTMKKSTQNLFLIFLLTLIQLPGKSQEVEKKQEKKWSKAMQLNAGASRFYMHNNPEAVQYPTFDMNLRFSAERLLFKRTYLLTGFNYTE